MTNGTPEYLVAQMNFSKATFLQEPYPIGLATEVFQIGRASCRERVYVLV